MTLCGKIVVRVGLLLILSFATAGLTAATVTASGSGATREAALQEAFKEAVRQGIGTYIESSTMIRNDEIIRENIIELAYGYVENHKVLSESKRGGVYRIEIEANVSNEEVSAVLANILPAETLSEQEREKLNLRIDSEISAQIDRHLRATRKAAIDKAAGKICRKIFEEYLSAVTLIYEFIPGEIQVVSANETNVELKVTGTIRANPDLYNLLLNSMIRKFERVLRKQMTWEMQERKSKLYYPPEPERSFSKITSASIFAVSLEPNALKEYRWGRKNIYAAFDDLYHYSMTVWHLYDIPFLKDLEIKQTKAELLICMTDKKGDILFAAGRETLHPCGCGEKPFISTFFTTTHEWKGGDDFLQYWPKPYLEARAAFNVSVSVNNARKVAGVKGILINADPAGEALLNELLTIRIK